MSAPQHVNSWYAASDARRSARSRGCRARDIADVCILGAGFTGLSHGASNWRKPATRSSCWKRERIGWGASGRNGGQAIFGFGCDQAKITSAGRPAMTPASCSTGRCEGLRPDARRVANATASTATGATAMRMCRSSRARSTNCKAWQRDLSENFDYPLQWWDREQLRATLASDRYLGAPCTIRNSGHLHPLKYTQGLARAALSLGVRIFEQSRVTRLVRGAQAAVQDPPRRSAAAISRCSPAMPTCTASRPELDRQDHAGRHLHRRHRAAGRGARAER